jgi:hypothetical protein
MRPVLFLFEDPDVIAERVAVQMGCTVEEAIDLMEAFDRLAVLDFCVGNEIPRSELN